MTLFQALEVTCVNTFRVFVVVFSHMIMVFSLWPKKKNNYRSELSCGFIFRMCHLPLTTSSVRKRVPFRHNSALPCSRNAQRTWYSGRWSPTSLQHRCTVPTAKRPWVIEVRPPWQNIRSHHVSSDSSVQLTKPSQLRNDEALRSGKKGADWAGRYLLLCSRAAVLNNCSKILPSRRKEHIVFSPFPRKLNQFSLISGQTWPYNAVRAIV